MKRTTLTKDQLRSNLAALQALIDGKPVEYYSPELGAWCETGEVCCDFEHRPKPMPDYTGDLNMKPTWNGQPNVEAAVAASLKKQPSVNVEDY